MVPNYLPLTTKTRTSKKLKSEELFKIVYGAVTTGEATRDLLGLEFSEK